MLFRSVVVEICQDKVWAMADECFVSVEGSFDKAKDVKKVEETIEKAFKKTGGTIFRVNSVQVNNS